MGGWDFIDDEFKAELARRMLQGAGNQEKLQSFGFVTLRTWLSSHGSGRSGSDPLLLCGLENDCGKP